jgi:hypothetical protein
MKASVEASHLDSARRARLATAKLANARTRRAFAAFYGEELHPGGTVRTVYANHIPQSPCKHAMKWKVGAWTANALILLLGQSVDWFLAAERYRSWRLRS